MSFDRAQAIDEIVRRVAEGEPLRAVCRDERMPAWRTVYDWLREDKDFADRMALARDLGQEALFQECLEIADTPRDGTTETTKEWGTERKKGDMFEHRKLQVWTRLQLLARWNPKKYAEGQKIEHSGGIAVTSLAGKMRERRKPDAGNVEDLL